MPLLSLVMGALIGACGGHWLLLAYEKKQGWAHASFEKEWKILDATYGQIFGGPAINYVATSIPKWAEVKASELVSNAKLRPTDVVMDLGCGPGFIARAVSKC